MCLFGNFLLIFTIIHSGYSDWVSEWLTPVQNQYKDSQGSLKNMRVTNMPYKNDYEILPVNRYVPERDVWNKTFRTSNEDMSVSFTLPLEATLERAKYLAESLRNEILRIEKRELLLKEVIANGRLGTSILTVTTIGRLPRTYIIRDQRWTLCNGVLQYPTDVPASIFNNHYTTLRCIGQEVTSRRDPCVFNSIIKYEVIPTTRRTSYSEDDYLCLKANFNQTLEKYLSVPKSVIEGTCKNGQSKSLMSNINECGLRVMSEYTYYPRRDGLASNLPLEYCTEDDGSCKLLVAWHLSNTTIENFEFFKNYQNFKKFFIKSDPYSETLI